MTSIVNMDIDMNIPIHYADDVFYQQILNPPTYWCEIQYCESQQLIGEPFKALPLNIVVNSLDEPGVTDGHYFTLGALANSKRSEASIIARQKIGNGISLEYFNEPRYCSIYYITNISDSTVHVHSKNYNRRCKVSAEAVIPLEKGMSMVFFNNHEFWDQLINREIPRGINALHEYKNECWVQISFGCAPCNVYKQALRHCWLNVRLNQPLKWVDQQMKLMSQQ
ncbi:hypothetical protein TSAR_010474 [Trichomalopsis sarcophagae]|uniref:MH2 domain-containing protein n=1 Tax=Trichomalopsis sarcophagae TaxID=543379 RepID=A0A232F9K1_9HYME|nr:hypothetical protein TSAR_010474 [Trichomalopsis sarcophagae]